MPVVVGSRVWAEQRSRELILEIRGAVAGRMRDRLVSEFVDANWGQAQRIARSLAKDLRVSSLAMVAEIGGEVLAAVPLAMADWDPQAGPFGSWLWRYSHDAARRVVETSSGFGGGGTVAMRRASAARRAEFLLTDVLGRAPSDTEIAVEMSIVRASDPVTAAEVSLLRARGLMSSSGVMFDDPASTSAAADFMFGESMDFVEWIVEQIEAASTGALSGMGEVFRVRWSIPDDPGTPVAWGSVARITGVSVAQARRLVREATRVAATVLESAA